MQLLTDGTENNPVLSFCLAVISRHGKNWPPAEEVLAEEFVDWFVSDSFLTRDVLKELCQSKGVTLSFTSLPPEIRGFNCWFGGKREIVVSEPELAPFGHVHTLFHEFREMLEHGFVELGHATLGSEDLPEVQAEGFAIACRLNALEKEFPVWIEISRNIEKKWARYLVYALFVVFGVASIFGCLYLPQMEEMGVEARRQRYVRT